MARSGGRRRYIAAWVAGLLLCFALVGADAATPAAGPHRQQRAGNRPNPRPCARSGLDRRRRAACDPPDIRVRARLAGLTRDRLERRPVPRCLGGRGLRRARCESRRERRDRRAGGWLRHLPGEREPGWSRRRLGRRAISPRLGVRQRPGRGRAHHGGRRDPGHPPDRDLRRATERVVRVYRLERDELPRRLVDVRKLRRRRRRDPRVALRDRSRPGRHRDRGLESQRRRSRQLPATATSGSSFGRRGPTTAPTSSAPESAPRERCSTRMGSSFPAAPRYSVGAGRRLGRRDVRRGLDRRADRE